MGLASRGGITNRGNLSRLCNTNCSVHTQGAARTRSVPILVPWHGSSDFVLAGHSVVLLSSGGDDVKVWASADPNAPLR